MSESKCELCGEPMPSGEEMFKFHGYSGPCPKPPVPMEDTTVKLSNMKAELDRLWAATDTLPNRRSFDDELVCLLNKYSKESGSNTPDFILSEYLIQQLKAWDLAVRAREEWYGRKFAQGSLAPPSQRPAWIDAAAKECAELVLVGAGGRTFAEIIEQHYAASRQEAKT